MKTNSNPSQKTQSTTSGLPRSARPSVLVDYLCQRDITANDGKKQMRRLTVEWGHAPPAVARVLIKPMPNPVNEVLRKAAERAEVGQ